MSDEIKRLKLQEIKKGMGNKKYLDYENIINEGIITKDDMIEAGIITENSIEKLKNIKDQDRVIDLSKPNYESPSKCTDVYFIGRPFPGISCLNMGLLASPNFNWIHNAYGQELMQLCKMGMTPCTTCSSFTHVTTGTINNASNSKLYINIIESGSAIFKSMVEHQVEPWGISRMLFNDNEKVLFILIDPTSYTYTQREFHVDGSCELKTVYQDEFLLGFLSWLELPKNKKVLNKVRAINVIVTKSDLLSGDYNKRDEIATEILSDKYSFFIQKLKRLLEDYSINESTDYCPQIFTFSLGKFYYGGIFEYDYTDSNKLLNAIACMSSGKRKKTWYEMLKDWFNN